MGGDTWGSFAVTRPGGVEDMEMMWWLKPGRWMDSRGSLGEGFGTYHSNICLFGRWIKY